MHLFAALLLCHQVNFQLSKATDTNTCSLRTVEVMILVLVHIRNYSVFIGLIFRFATDLSPNDRLKFRTITTIDVHARDIIEGFVRDNVTESSEFEWESQLRFYWLKKPDALWVKQCTGQ